MESKGSFNWRIDGQLYKSMLESQAGQKYSSQVIEMANLKWMINCYPNGINQQYKGTFMPCLTLLQLPPNVSSIILLKTTKCIETQASFTAISTYDSKHKTKGWPNRIQLIQELAGGNFAGITIHIQIKVLKTLDNYVDINRFSDNKHILSMLNKTFRKTWKINKTTFTKFGQSQWGNRFECDINDADLFMIYCFPYGQFKTDEGHCSLGIQLVGFPFWNATNIKIKHELSCIENDKRMTDTDILNTDQSNIGWNKFCKFDELFVASSLTFTAEINILEILDDEKQVLHKSDMVISEQKEEKKQENIVKPQSKRTEKSQSMEQKGQQLEKSEVSQNIVQSQQQKAKNKEEITEHKENIYSPIPAVYWNCDVCTYSNVLSDTICIMCQKGKKPSSNDQQQTAKEPSIPPLVTKPAEQKLSDPKQSKPQQLKYAQEISAASQKKAPNSLKDTNTSPPKAQPKPQPAKPQSPKPQPPVQQQSSNKSKAKNLGYDLDIISQLVKLGIGTKDECIKASKAIVDYKNPNAVADQLYAVKRQSVIISLKKANHEASEIDEEKVRDTTKQGQINFMGELEELIKIIQKQIDFMTKQEYNVNQLIQKSDKPQLLFDAKKVALQTEKDLMQQIMNISTMNQFLTDIILIENLFNASYTSKQRELQQQARSKYGQNLNMYENKPKPLSKSGSFVDLLFGAKTAFTSFKRFIKSIAAQCKEQGIEIKSNSGAKEKNIERGFYKSYYVYAGVYGSRGHEQMTDVLRCSIVFETFVDLYKCYEIVEKLAKSNGSGGILRVKDRFNPEHMPFGYRDLLINVKCKDHSVICEIQLHLHLFYQYKAISHNMYKKARLFEVNEKNLAYDYAIKHLRNEIGDKSYEIDDEKNEETDDPWIKLKEWKLEQYGSVLIDEEGYDDIELWKDLSEQELRNMEWEDKNGKKMKWKNGHIKKFIKYSARL